jgi:hypothetical protein
VNTMTNELVDMGKSAALRELREWFESHMRYAKQMRAPGNEWLSAEARFIEEEVLPEIDARLASLAK